MSAIRDYLEEKAALGDSEWLKREPYTTHPEILDIVRTFRASVGGGVAYDDLAEQAVEKAAGDLPEHRYHAHPERHALTRQLGHEVYIAQCLCRDEENVARANELREQGFVPLETADEGHVYDVASATLYSGYSEPSYGHIRERCRFVRREESGAGIFLPPRARVNGFRVSEYALMREVQR